MKQKLAKCLAVAAIVGLSSSLTAEFVKITSPLGSTGYQGLTATGTSLTADPAGTWSFQVGTFTSGFAPTGANFAEWSADWSSFQEADWVVSPAFLAGRIDAQWKVPEGSAFTGSQAYIWGFNTQAIDASAQWVLVTNDAWVFPANNPLSLNPTPENTWDLSVESNTYIVGTQLENGFQMQAIPEPSTYALIFGLGALGFLGFRRLRK